MLFEFAMVYLIILVMGCLLFYTVGNMHSVTSNAVAQAIQGGGWQTLVDKQFRGTFTIPDSAKEVLLMVVNESLNIWIGSFYIMMSMFDANTSAVRIPCDNDSRSIWTISNNGKTFTHNSSSGNYRISVFYK